MKDYNVRDFTECERCAVEPGSPPLCASCLNNRYAIADRDKIVDNLRRKLAIIERLLDL